MPWFFLWKESLRSLIKQRSSGLSWEKSLRSQTEGRSLGLSLGKATQVSEGRSPGLSPGEVAQVSLWVESPWLFLWKECLGFWGELPWSFSGRNPLGQTLVIPGRSHSGVSLSGDILVFLWEKLLRSLRGGSLVIPGRSHPTLCPGEMPWFFSERSHPDLFMKGDALLFFFFWKESLRSRRGDTLVFPWEKSLRSLTEGRCPSFSLGEVSQVSDWGETPWWAFSGRNCLGLWQLEKPWSYLGEVAQLTVWGEMPWSFSERSLSGLWLRGDILVFLWDKLLGSLTRGKALAIPRRSRPTHCMRGDALVFLWEKSLRCLWVEMSCFLFLFFF